MTKAHALRNYFKQVYDVDNLTGMSELAVWQEFLKENNDFDSKASSMASLYQELLDNNITFGETTPVDYGTKIFWCKAYPSEETTIQTSSFGGRNYVYIAIPTYEAFNIPDGSMCHIILTGSKRRDIIEINDNGGSNNNYMLYSDPKQAKFILRVYMDEEPQTAAGGLDAFLAANHATSIDIEIYQPEDQETVIGYTGVLNPNDLKSHVTAFISDHQAVYPCLTIAHDWDIRANDEFAVIISGYEDWSKLKNKNIWVNDANDMYFATWDNSHLYICFIDGDAMGTISSDADAQAWWQAQFIDTYWPFEFKVTRGGNHTS